MDKNQFVYEVGCHPGFEGYTVFCEMPFSLFGIYIVFLNKKKQVTKKIIFWRMCDMMLVFTKKKECCLLCPAACPA